MLLLLVPGVLMGASDASQATPQNTNALLLRGVG